MSAPKATLEVRGYAFGNEVFPRKQVKTITAAMTFISPLFAQHRGLTVFIESGDRIDDDTFVPHEGGLCLKLTEAPRTRVAVAAAVA